jgi:hypothetical protein
LSGLNLGYRTAEQIRERVEEAVGSMRKDLGMLCNELQMQEASYEILLDERRMLLAEIAQVTSERDEARREVCELDANGSLQAGTPTTVAGDRGWAYLYEKPSRLAALEQTAREMYKGGD